MEHLHLYRSIWKGILLKPTIRKIFGNLSYKMSWEKDSDCHKLHFSLISTTNFSWPKLNWTNLNQAESNLWCIFNTLTKDIFRYLVWSSPTLFSCVIFLHNLYIFPNFISCSKKYMEPIRAENHFWSPSLEFSSRHLVLSVKKRGKNSPSSQFAAFLPWAVARANFPLWSRCHCCGFFPGQPKPAGSGDGQWMRGHLRRAEPDGRGAAGQQVSLELPALSKPALQRGTKGQPLPHPCRNLRNSFQELQLFTPSCNFYFVS